MKKYAIKYFNKKNDYEYEKLFNIKYIYNDNELEKFCVEIKDFDDNNLSITYDAGLCSLQ